MRLRAALVALLAWSAWAVAAGVAPAKTTTVCTMSVNSSDEADAFRRGLPADRYRFVELVERGRSDWLASACRKGIRCDVLIVSGHYDGVGMFFSDRVDADEHLPVAELERAACSDSCPGLFEGLRQVYLFGCHTLGTEGMTSSGDGRGGALALAGDAADDAVGSSGAAARYGESSRERMRRLFRDVPAIHGFASTAPLGAAAGDVLARYFRANGTAEIGASRASTRLLAAFADHSMTSAPGITRRDPAMARREDVCRFQDDRLDAGRKAAFVHEILRRGAADTRAYLDHVEQFLRGVQERGDDAVLDAIAADRETRERFLAQTAVQPDPALRARLIALAHAVGWLDAQEQRAAWAQLLVERLDRGGGAADVALACRLGRDGALASEIPRLQAAGRSTARDAMLACIGDESSRGAVIDALLQGRADEQQIAAVLLQYRPLDDTGEYRVVAQGIARLPTSEAQVHALAALAGHATPDPASLASLAATFASTRSLAVQRGVANVMLRADVSVLGGTRLAQTLREHRIRSPEGRDVIDVLIRRIEQ